MARASKSTRRRHEARNLLPALQAGSLQAKTAFPQLNHVAENHFAWTHRNSRAGAVFWQ